MLAGEGIKHRLVCCCLGFNRRFGVVPQETKLGAQQTHAFSVQAGSFLGGFAVAHVRVEWHAGAVGEHAFTVEVGDRFAVSVFFGGFAVFIGRLGIDDTRVRVHIDLGAVWNIGDPLCRHDRGKTQAARQNRGMRLRTAVRSDQGDHVLRVKGRGICGGKINCGEHERLLREGDARRLLTG